MSDDRTTLSVTRTKSYHEFRREMAMRDVQNLALNEAFLRFTFTVLHSAGMFSSNYQPDGRDLQWLEGRRSLGLDILSSIKQALGADALTRILATEDKTLKEAPNGRSRTDDGTDDGDDLDGQRVQRAGSGLVFLDYGPERKS